MEKSAQAFRTIREVADWLDVAAHVLRFWESKFSQIKPVKRAGGRRYYRPADMAFVGGIKVLLHDRGMTIRGVQKMISDEGVDAVSILSPPIDSLLDNANVVQLDPSDAWDADAETEAHEGPADAIPEVAPAPEPALEPDPEPTAEPEPKAVAEVPSEPVSEPSPEHVQTEPAAASLPPAAAPGNQEIFPAEPTLPSISEPEEAVAIAAPPPQTTPVTPASEPVAPASAARSAPTAVGSPRSADALATLSGLARLSTAQRAALRPQIAALARLRDRMVAPRTGT